MTERRTVSYFEHQFNSSAIMEPAKFFDERGLDDMADIRRRGFDEVIVCVTEMDMLTIARRGLLRDLKDAAEHESLLVTADPWRVGGIFGGEGMSFYEQNGGKPCLCEPELEDLMHRWIDTVAEAGIKRIFWDEPELDCPDHNRSLELIDTFSQEAVARGIEWNSSCVRSRDSSVDVSNDVASMSAISEIAVAPYPYHPQSTAAQKTLPEVIDHISPWFERIKQAADKHGVEAQAWLQGFNYNQENLPVADAYVEQIKQARIGNIALWGYLACASVRHLNPPSAAPTDMQWEHLCEVMQSSRDDYLPERMVA